MSAKATTTGVRGDQQVLNIYRSLSLKEKALVWAAIIAIVILLAVAIVDNAGIVAGAQVAAAVGTLALAGLAFAQVRELREARIVQDRPQIIVDADYYPDSRINVVVRNIGKGAAKDITFDFSAPMVSSLSVRAGSEILPVHELGYFKDGIEFLAPGAEIVTSWDTAIGLFPVLRERGLEDGITVTSKYRSLSGEYHETPWTINPLRINTVDHEEKSVKHVFQELEKIREDFHKVVSSLNQELRVSTATEREQRSDQNGSEGG